jgi:hypothetical protein
MHNVLQVDLQWWDTWQAQSESERGVVNRALVAKIRVIHRESRETYGSPSIWDALIKQEYDVGEHRLARLMRQEGIGQRPSRSGTPPRSRIIGSPWLPTRSIVSSRGRIPTGCGRGHHLGVDHGGLALLGRGARSVLTPRDWVGDGPAIDRGVGRAGPPHGAHKPATQSAAANMGPRTTAGAHHSRHHAKHELKRQLLGQRLRRKFLRDVQA